MCTVTFIPRGQDIFLTSSRDEHYTRGKALPPQRYNRLGYEMVFPKDPDAGGTWIALRNKREAAVLLNGAFHRDVPQPPYRKSRGLILLDILASANPVAGFNSLSCAGIAPFTLILFFQGNLTECRWDGREKYTRRLNAGIPHIWSSVTLYDEEVIQQREVWFKEWLQQNAVATTENIIDFHETAGNGDVHNNVFMNRDNIMRTVSITSLFIGQHQSRVRYRDVQHATDFQNSFSANSFQRSRENFGQRLYHMAKRLSIRCTHWEYWPSWLIYFPVYFYWLWLSIKARSFFFFSAANPSIHYSGFAQERKSDIYGLIPQQYHPKTLLCQPTTAGADLEAAMAEKHISFPVIAKPDIGERGVQVKLLRSLAALEDYSHKSRVDFLIQEFISYDLEAGIFYYRLPGEKKGHISGIVEKEFLTVTGDGIATIGQLLKKDKRSFLQLPALEFTYGQFLDTVLGKGEPYTLVPYGNHSRGAKFVDAGYRITDELTNTIDHICQQIPGFYYGRLDVKFQSWDALCHGKELSVIELNGAGSEPTHIYDPAHSVFFAWREICRHWQLLYRISRLNAKQNGLRLMTFADGIKMKKDRSRHLKLITRL